MGCCCTVCVLVHMEKGCNRLLHDHDAVGGCGTAGTLPSVAGGQVPRKLLPTSLVQQAWRCYYLLLRSLYDCLR